MTALVPIAIGWMLGALLVHSHVITPWPAAYVALMLLLSSALIVGCAHRVNVRGLIPCMLGGCALIAMLGTARVTPSLKEIPEGLARIHVTIEQTQDTPQGPRAIARVHDATRVIDRRPLPSGTRLLVYGKRLPLGATLETLAVIKPWSSFRNPSPHPEWPRAPSEVIRASGRIPSGAPAWVIDQPIRYQLLERVRNALHHALRTSLDTQTAGMAIAWLLGETQLIPEETRASIQGAGLTHVLAVSGLNITLFAGFIVECWRRLLLRFHRIACRYDVRRLACLIGIPFALGYAAVAGNTSSGWRAALMSALSWIAITAGRKPTPSGIIAASVLCFCALNPRDAVGPAFLLSVVATVAIITATTKHASFWYTQLIISVRSMVATAPLVIWCFGGVPLIGLLANLSLVPVASYVLMPLSFGLAFIALVWRKAAVILGTLLRWGCELFVYACTLFEKIRWGTVTPPLSIAQGLILAIACIAILIGRSWRFRFSVMGCAILLFASTEWHLRHQEKPHGKLRATFLDVGQGDAALVDLPDGKLMLIDTGGSIHGSPDPGLHVITPLLKARRRFHIDIVVISHPHPDHYGGLPALLNEFSIGELWDNGQAYAEDPQGMFSTMLQTARHRGIRIVPTNALCNKPRYYANAKVEVLWPCPGYDPSLDINDNSLVIRIATKEQSFLLTGDIEEAGERSLLLRHPDLHTHVLKVPHHGSRTSSSAEFVAAVKPHTAIISAGRHNRFGHPHAEVVSRFKQYGITTISLAQHGGLILH